MLDRATALIPKMSSAIEILQQRVGKLVQNQEHTLLPIMNEVNAKLDEILKKTESNASETYNKNQLVTLVKQRNEKRKES